MYFQLHRRLLSLTPSVKVLVDSRTNGDCSTSRNISLFPPFTGERNRRMVVTGTYVYIKRLLSSSILILFHQNPCFLVSKA
jgi:hypothetical protein